MQAKLADSLYICAVTALFPINAYAYLDPGTGSMLFSIFIGLVSSTYFWLRKLPSIVRGGIFKLKSNDSTLKTNDVVIYAESAAYWNTFKPLLDQFEILGTRVLYLTSNEKDPVFNSNYASNIQSKFIGTGNKAYTFLNFIEANVVVLTTPGLDVLQIRRSKGVKKYIHVLHSITDVHFYKLFSFDYYDEVICSGDYQVRSIRALEKSRGTKTKDLPILGCPYFDILSDRVAQLNQDEQKEVCVLLAPSWGKNGMLTKFGSEIPKLLAETGFNIIFRPHPQSLISEKELIQKLQTELSGYQNLVWDKNSDGFSSMAKASILISDFSGIIFDFSFGFLKPVISVFDKPSKDGFEAFTIPHELWEISVLDKVGKRISKSDLKDIKSLIQELVDNKDLKEELLKLRQISFPNFGNSAKFIAREILKVNEELSDD